MANIGPPKSPICCPVTVEEISKTDEWWRLGLFAGAAAVVAIAAAKTRPAFGRVESGLGDFRWP